MFRNELAIVYVAILWYSSNGFYAEGDEECTMETFNDTGICMPSSECDHPTNNYLKKYKLIANCDYNRDELGICCRKNDSDSDTISSIVLDALPGKPSPLNKSKLQGAECALPLGLIGRCKLLHKCKSKLRGPGGRHRMELCGYVNNNPYVCCTTNAKRTKINRSQTQPSAQFLRYEPSSTMEPSSIIKKSSDAHTGHSNKATIIGQRCEHGYNENGRCELFSKCHHATNHFLESYGENVDCGYEDGERVICCRDESREKLGVSPAVENQDAVERNLDLLKDAKCGQRRSCTLSIHCRRKGHFCGYNGYLPYACCRDEDRTDVQETRETSTDRPSQEIHRNVDDDEFRRQSCTLSFGEPGFCTPIFDCLELPNEMNPVCGGGLRVCCRIRLVNQMASTTAKPRYTHSYASDERHGSRSPERYTTRDDGQRRFSNKPTIIGQRCEHGYNENGRCELFSKCHHATNHFLESYGENVDCGYEEGERVICCRDESREKLGVSPAVENQDAVERNLDLLKDAKCGQRRSCTLSIHCRRKGHFCGYNGYLPYACCRDEDRTDVQETRETSTDRPSQEIHRNVDDDEFRRQSCTLSFGEPGFCTPFYDCLELPNEMNPVCGGGLRVCCRIRLVNQMASTTAKPSYTHSYASDERHGSRSPERYTTRDDGQRRFSNKPTIIGQRCEHGYNENGRCELFSKCHHATNYFLESYGENVDCGYEEGERVICCRDESREKLGVSPAVENQDAVERNLDLLKDAKCGQRRSCTLSIHCRRKGHFCGYNGFLPYACCRDEDRTDVRPATERSNSHQSSQEVHRDVDEFPKPCTHSLGEPGVCTPIFDCPQNAIELNTECSANLQVVCCKKAVPHRIISTTSRPDYTTPRSSNWNHLTLPLGQFSDVGRRSRENCEEYSRRIYANQNCYRRNDGQDRASLFEYPHMAILGYQVGDTKKWACSGVLISERYVLAAAHCLNSRTSGRVSLVRLGELDLSTDSDGALPQEYEVDYLIPHPDYDASGKVHDVGLIRLKENATLNGHVAPACLTVDNVPSSMDVYAAGWRWDDDNYCDSPLRKVSMRFEDRCGEMMRGSSSNDVICMRAIDGQKLPERCSDDSVGVLQLANNDVNCMYNVIGVASDGNVCNRPNKVVFGQVGQYVEWIENIVWS